MLYLIANAESGLGKGGSLLDEIQSILHRHGEAFSLSCTRKRGDGERLAAQACAHEDCEGVVAIGGDGTFSEVFNGMNPSVPLGLIPAGTGNDFARVAGLTGSVEELLAPILAREVMQSDCISVNGRRCINIVGTGFDVDLLKRETGYHKRFKSSSYFIALLVTLLHPQFRHFDIVVDDEKEYHMRAFVMAVCNGRYYGGGLPISPLSRIDDAMLEMVFVRQFPRWKMPWILLKFLKGKLAQVKRYVEVVHCRKVSCTIQPFTEIQIEGDLFPMNSFTATLIEGGMKLFLDKAKLPD